MSIHYDWTAENENMSGAYFFLGHVTRLSDESSHSDSKNSAFVLDVWLTPFWAFELLAYKLAT